MDFVDERHRHRYEVRLFVLFLYDTFLIVAVVEIDTNILLCITSADVDRFWWKLVCRVFYELAAKYDSIFDCCPVVDRVIEINKVGYVIFAQITASV